MELNSYKPEQVKEAKDWVLDLQRKYYTWALDKKKKFHDFFNLVCSQYTLLLALVIVLKRKGARTAGVDGVNRRGLLLSPDGDERLLTRLRHELKSGEFRPAPVKKGCIPESGKTNGRELKIPTIRDRVVQTSLKLFLQPMYEPLFLECSHGYRPGRGIHTAFDKIVEALETGPREIHVVRTDVSECFGTVQHDIVMRILRERVTDKKVLRLVRQFLDAGVMTEDKLTPSEEGLAPGGVLSPLLLNICMIPFDRAVTTHLAPGGVAYVRYADDFLLVVPGPRSLAEECHRQVAALLHEHTRLSLNADKTKIRAVDEGFHFLGHHLRRVNVHGKAAFLVQPREKAVDRLFDRIREELDRHLDPHLGSLLRDLNPLLQSWASTFCRDLDTLVELEPLVCMEVRDWLTDRGYSDWDIEREFIDGDGNLRDGKKPLASLSEAGEKAHPRAGRPPPWMWGSATPSPGTASARTSGATQAVDMATENEPATDNSGGSAGHGCNLAEGATRGLRDLGILPPEKPPYAPPHLSPQTLELLYFDSVGLSDVLLKASAWQAYISSLVAQIRGRLSQLSFSQEMSRHRICDQLGRTPGALTRKNIRAALKADSDFQDSEAEILRLRGERRHLLGHRKYLSRTAHEASRLITQRGEELRLCGRIGA